MKEKLILPKFPINFHLTNSEAADRVKKICELKNYTFLSFCDKNGNECEYKNNQTYLKLFCNKCQKQWHTTTYNRFMSGVDCPNCNKILEDEAIKNIKQKCQELNYQFLGFCDKNQNECEWNGVLNTFLKLKCNNCGNIWCSCSYDNFIRDRKCPLCNKINKKIKKETIIEICNKRNWEIIDMEDENRMKCDWKSAKYAIVKCNNCGNIWRKQIKSFKTKSNCPECAKQLNAKKRYKNKNEALDQINIICHMRNYQFLGFCDKSQNECEWYGSSTYLILKCNNCGNMWKTCTFYNFTHNLRGCPKCKQSHLEMIIEHFLKQNNIDFIAQKRFNWLGLLSLDYYLPKYNIAIECQGKQHFKLGGWIKDKTELDDAFENTIERDKRKYKLCCEHGVKLLYFSNLHIEYPYEVIEDEKILLQKILESS